jgi:hypothetical protein
VALFRWIWLSGSLLVLGCSSSSSNQDNTGGVAGSDAAGSGGAAGDNADGAAGVAGSDSGVAGMDAGCADTSSDPLNCGSCGHSCLGGKCQEGRCAPVTLATLAANEPRYITLDSSSVYFTTPTGVASVAKNGSSGPTPLATTASGDFRGLTRTGTHLYWADATGFVYRTPLAGGAAQVLWQGPSAPETLVDESAYVYWADPSADAILRVAQSGGSAEVVSDSQGPGAYALTKLGDTLFWARRTGVLAKLALTAGTGAVKIGDANALGAAPHAAIAVQGTRVYWSYGGSAASPPIGLSVQIDGTGQTAFSNDSIWGIAADNEHVYWSRVGLTGAIKRRPKPDGVPEQEIASNLTEVRSLAVDNVAIYFSEYDASSGKGWIKRVAK